MKKDLDFIKGGICREQRGIIKVWFLNFVSFCFVWCFLAQEKVAVENDESRLEW